MCFCCDALCYLLRIVATSNFEKVIDGISPLLEASAPEAGQISGANSLTVLAFMGITVWNSLSNVSALHWHAAGGVYRQFHANRANQCGSYPGHGCLPPVQINHPLQLIAGENAAASVFTFYLEDCCREAVLPLPGYNSWPGFLAGPQGPGYRHLKVQNTSGGVAFYHLNCEHGTGEAICEFDHAEHIDIYGFKTEGNFVSLWARDCDHIHLFGTGGCACSANDTLAYPPDYAQYTPTLYRFERTPNYIVANLMDQGSIVTSTEKVHADMVRGYECVVVCATHNAISSIAFSLRDRCCVFVVARLCCCLLTRPAQCLPPLCPVVPPPVQRNKLPRRKFLHFHRYPR